MSPTLIRIFLIVPLTEAGISIAALSVSRIIIESSDSTVWPTSTQTSITSTSSTSPRSGILSCLIVDIKLPKDLVLKGLPLNRHIFA